MPDRYAVVGHPVAHSKSPWIHRCFARSTGEDLEYLLLEAPLDAFERTLDEFRAAGGKGVNVTQPFKEAASRYSSELSARARAAQAVNTLRFDATRVYGDNTDGAGLLRDLTVNLGRPIRSQCVLLLGAGGAARGVLAPLLAAGPARLVIANRTLPKALQLAASSRNAGRGVEPEAMGLEALRSESFDLVINATSAGLSGAALALPASVFRREALAYDMVYGRETSFLALARAAGVAACDGLGMLVEQAAEAFFVWRGVHPATAAVLAALRAH